MNNYSPGDISDPGPALTLYTYLHHPLQTQDASLKTLSRMTSPSTPVSVSITLIVCATAQNGIGRAGQLPWRLPTDMRFFKHATTLVPPSQTPSVRNVVLMGRKTWESIPARFRPFAGRLNIVISRSTDPQALGMYVTPVDWISLIFR